ncbi:hypothetical protein HC256_009991 [Beauveria bassiana]|nr:hypothetical protein HC256_009991 [Beauveria bassiana]
MPQYGGANRQTTTKHIQDFKTHFQHLRSSINLTAPVDRCELALTAMHYEQLAQANGERYIVDGSLQVYLADTWFPDWERQGKTANQRMIKWRDREAHGKLWRMLHDRYGEAIMWILPERLKNKNVHVLKEPGLEKVMALIDEKHPNLKEDLKYLSELTSHFIHYGRLPDKRLKMERSSEGNFSELLRPDECTEEHTALVSVPSPRVHEEEVPNLPSTEAMLSPPPSDNCINWDSEYQSVSGIICLNDFGTVDTVEDGFIDPRLM